MSETPNPDPSPETFHRPEAAFAEAGALPAPETLPAQPIKIHEQVAPVHVRQNPKDAFVFGSYTDDSLSVRYTGPRTIKR